MNYLARFKSITTFILDVDGVLTNSELIVLENGKMLRKMNTRDGYAIKRALNEGFRVAVITGGSSRGVTQRLKRLGMEDIYSGVTDKLEVFNNFVDKYQLKPDHILYMGDDLPDYLPMRKVGLSACPRDAAHEIIELSRYISPMKGGKGCVRDVIEKTMRIQNKWFKSMPDIQLGETLDITKL